MTKMNQNNHNLVSTVLVTKPIDMVWQHWISPDSIKHWNIPFDDWHCPIVENKVCPGGTFFFRMERTDGQEGFDYKGIYDRVIPKQRIESTGDDGRKTTVEFEVAGNHTFIRETFEPDLETPLDMQQHFTDAVLERFKKFIEQR